jgi:DNA-directed RNA polymerase specialized sigma24 family protein
MADSKTAAPRVVTHDGNQPLDLLIAQRNKYVNFLARRLHNRELAEEILQIVTLKIVERGSQLHSAERAEALLYQVLRNAVSDQYRMEVRSGLPPDPDPSKLEIAAPASAPNLCSCAIHELSQLKPEYAEVLRAVEMDGTSVLNYAGEHAISTNTASVRLHRARKSLRQHIVNTCGSCAGAGCFDCSC